MNKTSDAFEVFIDKLTYMRRLYKNKKYTKALEVKMELVELLDDVMMDEN